MSSRNPAEPQPVRRVEVLQVIKTTGVTGTGEDDSPVREVDQFFTMEGEFLFKLDRWNPETVELKPADFRWPGLDEEGRVRAVADYLEELSSEVSLQPEHRRFRGVFVQRLARLFREMTEKLYTKPTAVPERDPRVLVEGKPTSVFSARCSLARENEPLATTFHEFCGQMFLDVLRAEQEGKKGWDSEECRAGMLHDLMEHVENGRWIGAANFCAFMWNLDRVAEEKKGCPDGPSI